MSLLGKGKHAASTGINSLKTHLFKLSNLEIFLKQASSS
jgi:hypothetical protein